MRLITSCATIKEDARAARAVAASLVAPEDALEELGVESVEDLSDVTEDDLEPLGMKKLEIRRFNAGLKKIA